MSAGDYARRAKLEERRDDLYRRMEEGYRRIEEGLDRGEGVRTWEDLWLALLDEYERVCEDLQRDLAGG